MEDFCIKSWKDTLLNTELDKGRNWREKYNLRGSLRFKA